MSVQKSFMYLFREENLNFKCDIENIPVDDQSRHKKYVICDMLVISECLCAIKIHVIPQLPRLFLETVPWQSGQKTGQKTGHVQFFVHFFVHFLVVFLRQKDELQEKQ